MVNQIYTFTEPHLQLISATFDPAAMRVTALTQHTYYEFQVYSQDMLDAYLTIDNCSEFLRERSALPKKYSSYKEWAADIFEHGDEMEIMLDGSYHWQWEEICKLANIDYKQYPYSSLYYEDEYYSIPARGTFYGPDTSSSSSVTQI